MPIPASRDRLSRPVDISTLLDKAPRRVNIIVDEPGLRRAGLSGYGFRNAPGNGGGRGGGSTRSPVGVQRGGIGQGRNQQRAAVGVRDTRTPGTTGARRGGGRGRRQLPSWYPRTPLRDITGIMRAIESRRAELGLNQDTEAQQEDNNNAEPGNIQRVPEIDASTPVPTITFKPQPSPASQMWIMKTGNADWTIDSSEFLTPEKKLLNSIEKVREAWLEDQRKLERTPAAKRVEEEKKVRVLMSMR
ncbi:protein GIGAS CELL1-like [Silene latifolia]|uniref:protein GIGAS CELL1-like n=1 Tax=Silene latifolia TaxID=37657 RepID=UPI003D772F7B